MATELEIALYTMCVVQAGNRVLLVNRPDQRGFPGYLGPGGKVDFPESLTESAVREVFEETGLRVKNLVYKGVDAYDHLRRHRKEMVFNYLTSTFDGDLLENPPEGELAWVRVDEALNLPMQPWFQRRFPLFFQEGTFEIYELWDDDTLVTHSVKQL